MVLFIVLGAIVFGSAAYETGNLLGAMSGVMLIRTVQTPIVIILLVIIAAIALYFPHIRILARILGFVVVIMGISFFTTALMISPPWTELLKGSFVPSIPYGSGLIILGLVGTTVVPYNIFLGSGVANQKMSIAEMRTGLGVAIILGGIISMAVLITGTAVTGEFSFTALGEALSQKLGPQADILLGVGLFAAGISSAITAPLASAITAKSLFATESNLKWKEKGIYYRITWGSVLAAGMVFGLAGFKPIPAIIAAQAFNGLILPLVSIFLLFVVNDPLFMGKGNLNGKVNNILMIMVVWITLVLGSINVIRVIGKLSGGYAEIESIALFALTVIMGLISGMMYVMIHLFRKRRLSETSRGISENKK